MVYKKREKSTKFFLKIENMLLKTKLKLELLTMKLQKNKLKLIKTKFVFPKAFYQKLLKITTFVDKRYCNIYKAKTFQNLITINVLFAKKI